MTALDRLTARTHDSAGRMKQPCPHCGNIYEQEFVVGYWTKSGRVETWHCPRNRQENGQTAPCSGGSHTYLILYPEVSHEATAAALRGEK